VTEMLRAGQVAAAVGIGRETLRYYERRGLMAEPERTPGGHRAYPPDAVTRLLSIKAAQRLGFTLDEIIELAGPDRRRRGGLAAGARTKLAQVERRIAELQGVAALLRGALAAGCEDLDACAAAPECPLPFAPPPAIGPGR